MRLYREKEIMMDTYASIKCNMYDIQSQILTDMPKQFNNQKQDKNAINMIRLERLEEKIANKCNRMIDICNDIMDSIQTVDDSLCRQFLTLKYLNGYSWSDLKRVFKYEHATIQRIQIRALNLIKINKSIKNIKMIQNDTKIYSIM